MAFFLLLWLLNAVTEEQKKGIAAYFRPTLAVQNTSATFTILTGQAQPMDDMSGGSAQNSEERDDEQAMQQAPATGEGDRPQSMDGEKSDISTGNEPQPGKGDKPVDLEEAEKAVAAAEQKQLEQNSAGHQKRNSGRPRAEGAGEEPEDRPDRGWHPHPAARPGEDLHVPVRQRRDKSAQHGAAGESRGWREDAAEQDRGWRPHRRQAVRRRRSNAPTGSFPPIAPTRRAGSWLPPASAPTA